MSTATENSTHCKKNMILFTCGSDEQLNSADSSPPVVNTLSVSIQLNGKKRVILDFRYVNNFLKRRVKYEDWKVALSYFQKGFL